MKSRRDFLRRTIGIGAGTLASAAAFGQQTGHDMSNMQNMPGMQMSPEREHKHAPAGTAPLLVETPGIPNLPWEMVNGAKEFHLVAEPVRQEVVPSRIVDLWGYNGSAPGPTIQVNQGDRVRIVVDNHLPEPTSMHWHGFEIPHNMDGGPGISQDPIPPGGRFVYEFTLHQEGTFFYHSHMAMQEMFGMIGAFIMHPKQAYEPRADKDFAVILQEYAILPNSTIPNSMNMEFNWLTFNGKAGPAIPPIVVRLGDRVRIRLINLGMDHHPIHLHGHTFAVTGTEGGRQPRSTWGPGNTVLVGVAQSRDVEFVANNPGDWMLHCHLPHHMMNQMSSSVGPMSRRSGMPMGASMENGMGMLDGTPGVPLGDDYGPSLGRGMGVGSTNDHPLGNTPLSPAKAAQAMPGMQHPTQSQPGTQKQMPGMDQQGVKMEETQLPSNANSVPGFPQDAFMEGPSMAMDQMIALPGNFGLRPGWSGFMQGMMMFVRVLPPDMYDQVMERMQHDQPKQPNQMPSMQHQHGGR